MQNESISQFAIRVAWQTGHFWSPDNPEGRNVTQDDLKLLQPDDPVVIAAMLSMSRMEAGAFPLIRDWCSVNELVHSCLNRNEQQFQNRRIVVEIAEGLPLFSLDSGLMELALFNLLQNADIYTPENTKITVSCWLDKDQFAMDVADEGPGFPEESKKEVFDKFFRLPNSKTGGTGLGLSIVKGVVEAHNGSIVLENRPEGGAKFSIRIPAEISYINTLKHE